MIHASDELKKIGIKNCLNEIFLKKTKFLFDSFLISRELMVIFGGICLWGNLSLGNEDRVFDDAFGGYWVGIRRLDKKIGSTKFLVF
jgi:hypothetical protein